MCGIAGILSFTGTAVDRARIEGMIRAIRHRGPDSAGVYIDGPAGLGHARLSIIDVAGGAQPMSDESGSLWITFNGEIFNYVELRRELIQKGHRFRTRSDTEVLLHLYQEEGERCVDRLNGQWAFAIWDAPRRKLFLSRDRFGVRPLFYTRTPGAFLFASEIKALMAHPGVDRGLDLQSLNQVFTFWFPLPPRTAFRNIQQLPPGHSLVVEDGTIRSFGYWSLFPAPQDAGVTEREDSLAEELRELLLDAVRMRLRSDVPVGAYLSGGLDSSFIASLAQKQLGAGLSTFSVSFDHPDFDESVQQREASGFLHTRHVDVRCSGADIANVFPQVIWHAEQPVLRAAPAPLFLLSGCVRNSGFKVILTGEGADELLGGYDILKEVKIRLFLAKQPLSLKRSLLLRRLYPYMPGIQRQPSQYLARFFGATAEELHNPFFSHLPRWNMTARLKAFFSAEVRAEIQGDSPLATLEAMLPAAFSSWPVFHRAEHLETNYLLPGYILSSQGDRMAMGHSVEGRFPFLDHRVAEFAAKLPPQLKMKVLQQKYLLKQAARGWIPDSIRSRAKQPYRAPDGASFFAPEAPYLKELLSAENIRKSGIFDPSAVSKLVEKFQTGRAVGVRDNMAFLGILSTEILIDRFLNRCATAAPEGRPLARERRAS